MKPRIPVAAMRIGAAVFCTTRPAMAQAGWYAGLTIGSSNTTINADVVAVTGATATNLVKDERDPGSRCWPATASIPTSRWKAVSPG